jgi:hypothetical protein
MHGRREERKVYKVLVGITEVGHVRILNGIFVILESLSLIKERDWRKLH